MTDSHLRREIKKAVYRLRVERLPSVADYIAFLNRSTIEEQMHKAERDLKAIEGKQGINWRKVRDDV